MMADRTRSLCLRWAISMVCIATALTAVLVLAQPVQGKYFVKKEYVPHPLPTFAETRDKLPAPIYDEAPVLVQMYWKTWELGFRNFYEPAPQSGFVSQFIDAAFTRCRRFAMVSSTQAFPSETTRVAGPDSLPRFVMDCVLAVACSGIW